MIYAPGVRHGSYEILEYLGKVGRAEFYDVFNTGLHRVESGYVFDMDVQPGSGEWEYAKRVIGLFAAAGPNLPVLHSSTGVVRPSLPEKVLLIAIGRVLRAPIPPVCPNPETYAKILAQMTRSIAAMHDAGYSHGAVTLDSWRFSEDGTVTLVDPGPLANTGGAGDLFRRDVLELSTLARAMGGSPRSACRAQLISVLANTACEESAAEYPSARALFEEIVITDPVFARASAVCGHHDALRLSREELHEVLGGTAGG